MIRKRPSLGGGVGSWWGEGRLWEVRRPSACKVVRGPLYVSSSEHLVTCMWI